MLAEFAKSYQWNQENFCAHQKVTYTHTNLQLSAARLSMYDLLVDTSPLGDKI